MAQSFAASLIAWLPRDQRRPLGYRYCLVLAVGVAIALVLYYGFAVGPLDATFVYSIAISTFSWGFIELPRFACKSLLATNSPSYWPPLWRAMLLLIIAIPLGYILGTAVGDAYIRGSFSWDIFSGVGYEYFFLSLVLSLLFYIFFWLWGRKTQLELQLTQTQLNLLLSQLNPHMMFNTLANLRALINQNPERAITMLDQLNSFLRTCLSGSRQVTQSLQQECKLVDNYLGLMQIRIGTRMEYSIDYPEHLAEVQVPSFILQPLVENSIQHGIEPSSQPASIRISATAANNQLRLSVSDTGKGISKQREVKSVKSNYGWENINQRLKTLYGSKASMLIEQVQPHGVCVCLNLPLKAERR